MGDVNAAKKGKVSKQIERRPACYPPYAIIL